AAGECVLFISAWNSRVTACTRLAFFELIRSWQNLTSLGLKPGSTITWPSSMQPHCSRTVWWYSMRGRVGQRSSHLFEAHSGQGASGRHDAVLQRVRDGVPLVDLEPDAVVLEARSQPGEAVQLQVDVSGWHIEQQEEAPVHAAATQTAHTWLEGEAVGVQSVVEHLRARSGKKAMHLSCCFYCLNDLLIGGHLLCRVHNSAKRCGQHNAHPHHADPALLRVRPVEPHHLAPAWHSGRFACAAAVAVAAGPSVAVHAEARGRRRTGPGLGAALDSVALPLLRLDPDRICRTERVRRFGVTIVWFGLTLLLAVLIPNIGDVISLLGQSRRGLCLFKIGLDDASWLKQLAAAVFLVLGSFIFGVTTVQSISNLI
uniref:G_PROTEIN_RECEP_F2_4 domain-containing protein n=1 Tax=Macrostomum lignano TaxID=282301 RepID=A0A1I8FUK1_9PLAT